MIMEKKKRDLLKILFLIIIIGFLLYKTLDYHGAIGYRETWSICLDYMHEGILWTGQPHCEGAIIPFYILYALDSVFGREYVQIATVIFSTLITIMFFWVFMRVVKKELGITDYFFPGLLFWLLFYINTITDLEAILNSFFFFCAYYFLFYREDKYKNYFCGIFLLFAMLSKINVIIQIGFLLLWYLYYSKTIFIEDKKIKIKPNRKIIFNYLEIFVPIIIGFSILTVLYNYFWVYSLHIFTNQVIERSFFEAFVLMITPDIVNISLIYVLLISISVISTYLFIKEKKFYSLLSGPVFFISMLLIARAFGIDFVGGLRYWSVIMPFSVLMILRLRQLFVNPLKRQIYMAFIIMVLIFPGLYTSPFHLKDDLSYIDKLNIIDRFTNGWQEKDELIKQIHYGYSIVPEQDGRVLIESDPSLFKRTLVSLGSNIPYEKVDYLSKKYMESHPDIWGFPRYQDLLGENIVYDPVSNNLNDKEKEIIKDIEAGKYSLIIFGPPEWAISERIIANVNNETLAEFCQVAVPNNVWLTEEGWHFSYFMFKEESNCIEMLEKMYVYYYDNYGAICGKDKFTANSITSTLRLNGIPFNKECASGGNSLEYLKKDIATKKVEILILLALLMLPFILFLTRNYNNTEISKKQKKLCLFILTLLFIIFIMCLLFINGNIPYSDAIVQTIG